MSNDILSQGNEIIVETMDFKSLQKRKKETEKNEKGRFKKKKRFGKSIAKHAPSMLINIIERKALTFNTKIIKVDKFKYRASQYNHITGEYVKHKLNERRFYIGDYECQRDLYSAFLLKCYKNNEEMARNALRVLAFGYKELDHKPDKVELETIESDLILYVHIQIINVLIRKFDDFMKMESKDFTIQFLCDLLNMRYSLLKETLGEEETVL